MIHRLVRRRLSPLDEFRAMPPATHGHAVWFLAPRVIGAPLERLDAWAARAEIAGPSALAALRAAAGLVGEKAA
jgi:hypothetical protein